MEWRPSQALGYYAQYTALGNLMGLQANGQVMLLAGMGTFGYEPKVNRLFGFPRSISPGGVALDIPIAGVQIADGNNPETNARFSQQIGLLSSALEHATPEQMFSTDEQPADAISAVKALSKANAEGQRIYELTRDNMAETLPNLNLAFETEAEIQTALNAGLTVIAHTDNVSVPGWTGAGYIIFDPETGGGAYKISGGQNGGFIEKIEGFFAALIDSVPDWAIDIANLLMEFAKKTIGKILEIFDIIQTFRECDALSAILILIPAKVKPHKLYYAA